MISIVKVVPWDELEEKIRQTSLLQQGDGERIFPYANATITLERVAYSDVSPPSLYVLRENLATQTVIATQLKELGHDPLELDGALVLKNENGEEIGLVPPIVEDTDIDGKYVLDGAHRTSIGRWAGRTHFMAIHITGISPDAPSYALPNSWNDIQIMESVPSNPTEKKHYRENYRALYRDFSAINGGSLREA